jgi:serine protease
MKAWNVAIALLLAMSNSMTSVSAQQMLNVSPETVVQMLEQTIPERFVPGEVIVKYRVGKAAMSAADMRAMGFMEEGRVTSGGEVLYRLPTTMLKSMTTADARNQTMRIVRELAARADVEYAQPNYILHIVRTPNDPLYSRQWHYFDNGTGSNQSPGGINLPTAWDNSTGDAAITVAVIDTGILPNHPDIAGSPNLSAGYDMISDNFIANDGGGRDNDPTDPGDAVAAGECFPGSPPQSDSWHGSHVAGTIGVGTTDNGVGVAGINWQVRLQAVRVLGKCGGTIVDINDAIRWAAGLPVPGTPNNATPSRVINMSLGGAGACSSSPSTQAAINDAVTAGATVVVAAGNEASDAAGFLPASCNNVITVAAGDYRGHLASRYSNFGATVEIMAPGGDVLRDDNNDGEGDGVLSIVDGGYALYNGTSMATPHVAGVAALLLAQQPGLSPQLVTDRIIANAIPRSGVECPRACGAGLLNADFAAAPPPPPPPGALAIAVSPDSLTIDVNQSATITATVTRGTNPASAETVAFTASGANVDVAPPTAQTDASGNARATVTGVAQGTVVVTATVQGISDSVTVEVNNVPLLPLWGLLGLVTAMLMLGRRWFAEG